jgi:hypothetical protein
MGSTFHYTFFLFILYMCKNNKNTHCKVYGIAHVFVFGHGQGFLMFLDYRAFGRAGGLGCRAGQRAGGRAGLS